MERTRIICMIEEELKDFVKKMLEHIALSTADNDSLDMDSVEFYAYDFIDEYLKPKK